MLHDDSKLDLEGKWKQFTFYVNYDELELHVSRIRSCYSSSNKGNLGLCVPGTVLKTGTSLSCTKLFTTNLRPDIRIYLYDNSPTRKTAVVRPLFVNVSLKQRDHISKSQGSGRSPRLVHIGW